MDIEITKKRNVKGVVNVPGDKSISHRAIMFGSIAEGDTIIEGFLKSDDCFSTINCMRKLGVNIDIDKDDVYVKGNGMYLRECPDILDAGNSGTTMRLLSGILAGQKFTSTITGDESLRKRPMKRIIKPLNMMGAEITAIDDNYAPLIIKGNVLKGINYKTEVASAQVKSCIMLASLYADDETIIEEPFLSRNHSELMLNYFGGNFESYENRIVCHPVERLHGCKICVPGDISSAAYFIVAASILPQSEILIKNVNVNHTRTGIIDVIKKMGGNIEIKDERVLNNEPVADIIVKSSCLKGIEIGGEIIPRLIDEIPIIAVAASYADGETVIKDAEELKVKESNRIDTMVSELKKMGADIEATSDGMIIHGKETLNGALVDSYNDHRVAMSLSIAALKAEGSTKIKNAECVNISFPDFYSVLNVL
ncbi:MAG: 3-phosphoshikimate 1-carboxyvinyltransferase [Thermoanaerobacterium sp.]|uniref:3-phosphoshikimate 1-carboxyvinyltransferase n=1 Tax=Thermoanaerobacterium butyriciformans TaxID=1702242 RepID=A0ABS4NF16_9THEO|nr:3-phosphoshikimate 1-carboxyvinyltransferase [Thermoanaerobacterium butyriciformans]MBP2072258.1 3-phosphoshikimate 1-carboxyvinyltransferase [Thermoanaerobacterium butyriciformans]MDI3477297.1 3-phosphoshikimate 1-carboxyvinyltransferase [Thermoanaerobacterium sp.]MDK2805345.1 3-phosphoshikimate 1-carboxyvinyltransferase [Thermoanaerobacterium sp.]MDN5315881.1 3-phosphoshikimate 1-carboxyvinyltransferase [Thermoanaerobacterium sp.]